MDVCRLKLKIGSCELEAEGPQKYVEKQQELFLARLEAKIVPAAELERGETKQIAERRLDLGNGNTVVAPSSNLHAKWKI